MKRPPDHDEAAERGLLEHDRRKAVHTFSNGSHWDSWASHNCHECKWYDASVMGNDCAFECAAFLNQVSPALADLFGWVRDEEAVAKYGVQSGYDPPSQCAFFWDGKNDQGEDMDPPPPPDPNQLVLLADPTEDAAHITNPDDLVRERRPDIVEEVMAGL